MENPTLMNQIFLSPIRAFPTKIVAAWGPVGGTTSLLLILASLGFSSTGRDFCDSASGFALFESASVGSSLLLRGRSFSQEYHLNLILLPLLCSTLCYLCNPSNYWDSICSGPLPSESKLHLMYERVNLVWYPFLQNNCKRTTLTHA